MIEYLYDENSNIYGFIYRKNQLIEKYLYKKDILGNILGILDERNEEIIVYTYDDYGNLIIDGINSNGQYNSIKYKGYYYDEETELFYCNSRYYSPKYCRFISPDSVDYLDPNSINGLNLYSYCMNDPINYYDPCGNSAILAGLIIGAAIGLGVATYIDYRDDGRIFNGSIKWYNYLDAIALGGALMLGATGTTTLTITGAQVLGAAGLLGATYMFAKGGLPNNQYQNKNGLKQ